MTKKLEIIGFNIESCRIAQDAGADRIELCASPGEGGTTPSYGLIEGARNLLQIDLYVMIRPRGGDFLYTHAEFETMKADVEVCKRLHCDGVVFGILRADGTVDKERCRELLELAKPLKATFHRAFDRVNDPFTALEDVISLGFERILTSGLRPKAVEAIDLISALVQRAAGRISIMPGSGVTAGNMKQLMEKTEAWEFHSSGSGHMPSAMTFVNPQMQEELQVATVDADQVRGMKQALQE